MLETTSTILEESRARYWSQHLQQRVMRRLLQHDEPLFRSQFRQFFIKSALPQLPLLRQYDRYMRLRILSNELLEDIMPRIRRQLSLKTNHARLREEAPTRGDIDWQRTIERSWNQTPGLPPLQFDTRLRQRTLETPENILTIAILLAYRRELQAIIAEGLQDEELDTLERQFLAGADAHAQRELAAPYAHTLLDQARATNIDQLIPPVTLHLRPGPYHDLLNWWQRFNHFRTGRANAEQALSLASKRDDEKVDAWLYELWIALEYIHLFAQTGAVQAQDVQIATDALQCTFTWKMRGLRFLYNRQLDTSTSYEPDWEHGPATRPDYTIERVQPLEVRHQDTLIWREPPFVLDAKYYLGGSDPTNTHLPIKKLLGDMTLLGSQTGALFFPHLPEPGEGRSATRIIRRTGTQYVSGGSQQQIHLYHIDPTMSLEDLQQRLRSILDLALDVLPARPQPVCEGVYLDRDTMNSSRILPPAQTILCPKRHIGTGIYDLVNSDTDCLKNPQLCHIMGQSLLPPFIVRVTTREQLEQQSLALRTRSKEQLDQAEGAGDEARAEYLRTHIFTGIGRTLEQYVKMFSNTRAIEENFERWVFGTYWKQDLHSLGETVRNTLVSGEYVWQTSQDTTLHDWAASAIQYCRALEFELKRRLYLPSAQHYSLTGAGFTLGTLTYGYTKFATDRNAQANWQIMLKRVEQSGSDPAAFECIVQRIIDDTIKERRNNLAHGGTITREDATQLRESIIGDRRNPGVLCWLVEHVSTI